MKIIIAKALIAVYLCLLAYHYFTDQIMRKRAHKHILNKISTLDLHPKNLHFLDLYALDIILGLMACSLIAIISKSPLPKILSITGLLLWSFLSPSPQQPLAVWIQNLI